MAFMFAMETLLMIAFAVLAVTQVILPIAQGRRWFPMFRNHDLERLITEAKTHEERDALIKTYEQVLAHQKKERGLKRRRAPLPPSTGAEAADDDTTAPTTEGTTHEP